MEIRSTSLNFPRMRGGGPRTAEQSVVFPRTVDNAVAALAGYSAGFRGDDHHLGRLQVKLDTEVNGNVVVVRATFGLRDWSGDWDDDYAGTLQASVLAELVDPSLPPPRGDLQISGIETSQVIQSFRSGEHLDADHVLPDNAISLIGGKMTGLRVYVDYGAAASLPAIARLSGEVEVLSGANSLILAPIAPIVPRRDSEIDRGSVDHTLNFAIPAAWCRGTIDIRCRVFAAGDPTQSSAPVRRTLRFVDVNPLRVFAVGIHYTGQGMDLAAPDASTALQTFDFARRTFPTGDVLLSGYTDLTFGEDMVTTDTTGCGDGFESLNGKLKDLRGDSDDLYYGLLPIGVNFGTFVGCGGDGVGSGLVGDQDTAAHEAGHAYGRKHAPCDDSGRCDDPSNQDGDYPRYALFDSDSIGEFGFDPEANRVFDPATAHDFMGYSPTAWVSPYTYAKLMARGDPIDGAAGAVDAAAYRRVARRSSRAEWSRRPAPLLFLELEIDEARAVHIGHLFTFPARPRQRATRRTDFHAEIRDEKGDRRACVALAAHCFHCGPACWPLHLSAELPIDRERARTLVIRESDREIASFPIPQPPYLTIDEVAERDDGSALLRWSVKDKDGLMHLVQWQDVDGSWRGLAPRQTATEAVVPRRLRLQRSELSLRVLSSNGLATAMAVTRIEPPRRRNDPDDEPPVKLVVTGEGVVMRAWALDVRGRSLDDPALRWFDERGGEIARGSTLDTRQLDGGRRSVRVAALNAGAGKAERDVDVLGRRERPIPPPADACEPCKPRKDIPTSDKEHPSC